MMTLFYESYLMLIEMEIAKALPGYQIRQRQNMDSCHRRGKESAQTIRSLHSSEQWNLNLYNGLLIIFTATKNLKGD